MASPTGAPITSISVEHWFNQLSPDFQRKVAVILNRGQNWSGLRRHAFKEDMAMHEPNKSRDVSALIALVNAVIEYWKEIARRNFVKANPQAEPSEFERRWPKALANLLLAD